MMKKLSCIFVLLVGLAMSSVCLAHDMLIGEFAVGDIRQGQTFSEVVALMGQPSSTEKNYIGDFGIYVVTYYFSENFYVSGWAESKSSGPSDIKVRNITCSSREFATPSGIRVGDAYKYVAQRFGQGAMVPSSKAGFTNYCYEISGRELAFLVNKQGVITKIIIATEV